MASTHDEPKGRQHTRTCSHARPPAHMCIPAIATIPDAPALPKQASWYPIFSVQRCAPVATFHKSTCAPSAAGPFGGRVYVAYHSGADDRGLAVSVTGQATFSTR